MSVSMFWQYFSFRQERWDTIFGGGLPGAERHVVASATWDGLPAWDDEGSEFPDASENLEAYLDAVYRQAPASVVRMATRICTLGISYDGLDRREAAELDSMIVGFFCKEGLQALLQYKIEHRNGLHGVVVAELLSRARPSGGFLGIGSKEGFPVSLATAFDTGRRMGTTQTPDSSGVYFVLRPSEVPVALQEVDGLLALDRPWRTPEFRDAIDAELRGALVRARDGGLCLAGRWT